MTGPNVPSVGNDNPIDSANGVIATPYGLATGDSLWMHSVVKNCSGVIHEIMGYVAPAPTPSQSPSSATFGCTAAVLENVVGNTKEIAHGAPKCLDDYAEMTFTSGTALAEAAGLRPGTARARIRAARGRYADAHPAIVIDEPLRAPRPLDVLRQPVTEREWLSLHEAAEHTGRSLEAIRQ